jgi:hypothetical protein
MYICQAKSIIAVNPHDAPSRIKSPESHFITTSKFSIQILWKPRVFGSMTQRIFSNPLKNSLNSGIGSIALFHSQKAHQAINISFMWKFAV